MDAWFKQKKIKKVKHIPDGALEFTRWADTEVNKSNIGFGPRSWRYAVVIDDMVASTWFIEGGTWDEAKADPFVESTAERLLDYFTK